MPLYFHHNWPSREAMAGSRFPAIRDHVLLPWASRLAEADRHLRKPRAGTRERQAGARER